MWILESSKNLLYWNLQYSKILAELGGYGAQFISITSPPLKGFHNIYKKLQLSKGLNLT